ncbi:MAG: DUF4105 domain-containing protein [Salibacteraceae bacterium]
MRIKSLLIGLSFFWCSGVSAVEAMKLSPDARVSVLTCSPGEELYSLFGHSAIRVYDPNHKIDHVFNYGTFTFDDDFYLNFAMGRLNYRLSVQDYGSFLKGYFYEQRYVFEQELNLDSAQRQTIFNYLFWNQLPENRYYLYDFFYKNCSSVIRDVLTTTLGESLEFKDLTYDDHPSFRQMIDVYLVHHPWGDFGIDLGLGLPCDKIPTSYEYMFLPHELERAIEHATLDGELLAKPPYQVIEGKSLQSSFSIFNPVPLFWLLAGVVAILSALAIRRNKPATWLDYILLTAYGLLGCLITFLWFFTDHNATGPNLNVLWAWPIHLPALMVPFFSKRLFGRYMAVYAITCLITLLLFPLLPQQLHLATIPLMVAALARGLNHVLVQ